MKKYSAISVFLLWLYSLYIYINTFLQVLTPIKSLLHSAGSHLHFPPTWQCQPKATISSHQPIQLEPCRNPVFSCPLAAENELWGWCSIEIHQLHLREQTEHREFLRKGRSYEIPSLQYPKSPNTFD